MRKRIFLGILLLLAVMGFTACGKKSPYVYNYGNLYDEYGGVLYSSDGKVIYDDTIVKEVYWSTDLSQWAFIDDENTLYVIKKNKIIEVAEDVSAVVISSYGDSIAYLNEMDGFCGTLSLYNVKKEKSKKIYDEAAEQHIVVSPDGKSVAFVNKRNNLYMSKNGKKAKQMYEGAEPVAITNKGKNIFYLQGSTMYVNKEKLYVSGGYYFNMNNTELIYWDNEGSTSYYTLKSKKPAVVAEANFWGVLTPATGYVMVDSRTSLRQAPVESFEGVLVEAGGSIYKVSKKVKSVKQYGWDVQGYQLDPSSKRLLYWDFGELNYVKKVNKSSKPKVIVKDLSLDYFVSSENMKEIYFEDNGELFYLNGKKSVYLSEVESGELVYSDKYDRIYFIHDRQLYCAETKEKSVKEVSDITAYGIWKLGENVFISGKDGSTSGVYILSGKEKIEEVFSSEE